jgi:hypothetical protein
MGNRHEAEHEQRGRGTADGESIERFMWRISGKTSEQPAPQPHEARL